MVQLAVTLLLYPGLALLIGLALLVGWLVEGRACFAQMRVARLRRSLDGIVAVLSVLLAALGLALLPWPLHPATGWRWIGHPMAIWVALEGAFLLAALSGLLAPTPLAARAAARAAQMSVAGRCVVWLAIGTLLWGDFGWSIATAPGRLLIGLAGLLALPAAIGAGPFGAERSLSAVGAEHGLDEATTGLVRFAHAARGAALLAALAVAATPPADAVAIQPWIALLLILALLFVVGLALRRISGTLPRLTLPSALRWCWWRALPLAIAGMVYLLAV